MIKIALIPRDSGAEKVIRQEYMPTITERIKQRRFQMLVHSYIYYEKGTSIVSDATFDRWAYELRDLQKAYPKESESADLYIVFKNWDGTTGYNLPYSMVKDRAEWLLEVHKHANKQ